MIAGCQNDKSRVYSSATSHCQRKNGAKAWTEGNGIHLAVQVTKA